MDDHFTLGSYTIKKLVVQNRHTETREDLNGDEKMSKARIFFSKCGYNHFETKIETQVLEATTLDLIGVNPKSQLSR